MVIDTCALGPRAPPLGTLAAGAALPDTPRFLTTACVASVIEETVYSPPSTMVICCFTVIQAVATTLIGPVALSAGCVKLALSVVEVVPKTAGCIKLAVSEPNGA